MGLGQITVNKEYMKGIIFAVIEIVALLNFKFFTSGIRGLATLGRVTGYPVEEVAKSDHSIRLLIVGIMSSILLGIIVISYIFNILDAIHSGKKLDRGFSLPNFKRFMKDFWDKAFPYIMMAPALILVVFFVLMPIIFGIALAFTNYGFPNNLPQKNLVSWVGFGNISKIVKLPMWNNAFVGIFSWTVIWAVLATFTCFSGGLLVALLLNSKFVKYKKFWRTIFILPYSVPGLISLLVWSNMLNGQFGPINMTLKQFGIIDTYFGVLKTNIGWLSDPLTARITVILVNLWLGFPYFMALLTGIMTSISEEMYEAAEIDGATNIQKFRFITLPMVIIATTPLIIMSFSANFNNFGAIYFLTQGGPSGTYNPAVNAGATDILITWIYKLTIDKQMYNIAALMSLIIFIIIGGFSFYNFKNTKAFKDDEF
jgi:arabinogalactan oligomer/maltooligosaccharide transport system permease protein